jgi:tRNA-modifying protein YgfZ
MTPANDPISRPTLLEEYAAARTGAALFDRSAAAKIELAGPEAAIFLHNLSTQDVKKLADGEGCETFLTNAKARVVAHGAVSCLHWHGHPVYWFDTEPGQAEPVLQHLNHFLISEQVELADRTSGLGLLRLVGSSAAAIVTKACGATVPTLALWRHATLACDGAAIVVRYHNILNLPGYDCFCEASQTPRLRERLITAGALPAGAPTHELLRVEAGWPVVGIDMDENRFVVEVGRGAQAICYTKGCFLGQEPIVMARDRGQVNRMLLGILCGAGPTLAAGTRLFQGDAEVGQITSSVESPRLGQTIALAYIRRGSQEPGTKLTIEPIAAGRHGVVSSLPFA